MLSLLVVLLICDQTSTIFLGVSEIKKTNDSLDMSNNQDFASMPNDQGYSGRFLVWIILLSMGLNNLSNLLCLFIQVFTFPKYLVAFKICHT